MHSAAPCWQLFAAYVMCGAQQKDAVRLTLEQVDVLRRMCAEYQELELVTSTQGEQHTDTHTQTHTARKQHDNPGGGGCAVRL